MGLFLMMLIAFSPVNTWKKVQGLEMSFNGSGSNAWWLMTGNYILGNFSVSICCAVRNFLSINLFKRLDKRKRKDYQPHQRNLLLTHGFDHKKNWKIKNVLSIRLMVTVALFSWYYRYPQSLACCYKKYHSILSLLDGHQDLLFFEFSFS